MISKNLFYSKYVDFDWKFYINYYKDLKNSGLKTEAEAIMHYWVYGRQEARIFCSPKITKKILEEKENDTKSNSIQEIKRSLMQTINKNVIPEDNAKTEIIQKKNNYEIYPFKNYFSHNESTSKKMWRDFCVNHIPYLNLIYKLNQDCIEDFASVFIEFKILKNIEFVVKNSIYKLGYKTKHYIICGNENYSYIKKIFNQDDNIQIINIYQNVDTASKYSQILLDKKFWNLFQEKYLLIYQEDSTIFNFDIKKFIRNDLDYVGACWDGPQSKNCVGVGNGGFSLRNRSKMIKCLDYYQDNLDYIIDFLELSDNAIYYIKNTNSTVVPEDLFFSYVLQKYSLGKVANVDTANSFSQEQFLTFKNNLGGHNWWLTTHRILKQSHNFNIDFFKIFETVIIESPYEFTIGGGEIYISNIIKYFLNRKKRHLICLFIPNYLDFENINKVLKIVLGQKEISRIKIFPRVLLFHWNEFKSQKLCDYFFSMSNVSIPEFKAIGKYNYFHCQFPFDIIKHRKYFYDQMNNDTVQDILNSYDFVFLNSEFTKTSYANLLKNKGFNCHSKKLKIVSPLINCKKINNLNCKLSNSFILVGRIFAYDTFSNYKGIEECIKVFNKFPHLTLNIVGGLKDDQLEYYSHLLNLKKDNIHIYPNATEEQKKQLLLTCKYIINMAGINCKYDCNYEHFGIAIIEGINNGCIPISINRGYPSYYIPKNNQFKDLEELFSLLNKIQNKKIKLKRLEPQYQYGEKQYFKTLDEFVI